MVASNRLRILCLIAALVLCGAFYTLKAGSRVAVSDSGSSCSGTKAQNNILLERADTELKRQKGLSGRESMPDDCGMLFVFDQPGLYGFWMKDMKFSLDMVWLDDQKKVVSISSSVDPGTYPKVFTPEKPVRYVIELNAGKAARESIFVGSTFDF